MSKSRAEYDFKIGFRFSEEAGIARVAGHTNSRTWETLKTAAVTHAFLPSFREAETGGAGGVQVHTELHGKSEASLCHTRPYLKKKENRNKNYRQLVVL